MTVVLSTKGSFTHIDLLHEKPGSDDSAHAYHQGWTEVLGFFLDELNGTTLRISRDFSVSTEQLFQALSMGALFRCVTTGDDFKEGKFEFREGGSYEYGIGKKDYARGTFLRIVPNEVIRFSWSTLDSGLEVKDTEVILFLEKLEVNRTRHHLVHDGLPTRQVSESHLAGWQDALESLSESLAREKGKMKAKREKEESQLDKVFFALSDRTRRSLLASLSEGDSSVTELSRPFNVTLQAIMKHLVVLEDAGLISVEKTGRVKKCHFEPEKLTDATEWVIRYQKHWENQLEGLEKYFKDLEYP